MQLPPPVRQPSRPPVRQAVPRARQPVLPAARRASTAPKQRRPRRRRRPSTARRTPSPSCLTRREGMHALPLFYFTSSFARQVVYVISSDCLQKTPTRGWRRHVSQRGLKLRRVDPEQVIQRYQELRNLE